MTKLIVPGINIDCSEIDFIEKMFNFSKICETRDSNSLDSYIGMRVGLVRTGKGKATLVGYAKIFAVTEYDNYEDFRSDYQYHRVPKGSKYDFKNKKYAYWLINVERCEPRLIETRGNVAREVA